MGTPVVTKVGIPVVDKRSPRLTDAFIRAIKVPCKHGDGHGGHGLTIVVRNRAGGGLRRFWRQTVTIGGKKRSTGLGSYPLVTLKVARETAFDNARKIAHGEDILGPAAPDPSIPSLGDVFDSFAATQYAATLHRGEPKKRRGSNTCGTTPNGTARPYSPNAFQTSPQTTYTAYYAPFGSRTGPPAKGCKAISTRSSFGL